MRIQLSEILNEINSDLDLLATKYNDNKVLFNLFKYAFNPEWKFNLPEGKVEYPDYQHLVGYAPVSLYMEMLNGQLDVFCRKDLTEVKLTRLFTDLLEQLDVNDCEILFAIKDQTLNKLYKKLTLKNILPYFKKEA